jgi:hypothetical protein
MQTLKDVLSRKDERENLKNFLFSLTTVVVLVSAFFGFHAVRWMFTDGPDLRDGLAMIEAATDNP